MQIHGNGKGYGDLSRTLVLSVIAYIPNVLLFDFKFSHSEITILGHVSKNKVKCHLIVSCLELIRSTSIY